METSGSISTISVNNHKNKTAAAVAGRAVRAGTSKSKSASRSLRTAVPASLLSVLETAAPSVTGKRKRGKGLSSSKNVITTVHEEEEKKEEQEQEQDDELGQENIDTRFSPASSLTLRRNKASSGPKGAKARTRQPSNGRQRRRINVNHNDNDDNGDDGVDELASPGHLEKRVRKTDGGIAARKIIKRHRVPSGLPGNDDDGGDEISSATNSVVTALLSRKAGEDTGRRTLREGGSDKRRVPVLNGHGSEGKLSLKGTGRKSRRELEGVEEEKHVADAVPSKVETSAENFMSSTQQNLTKGRPRGRPKGKAKVPEKDDAEPENTSQTATGTKVKKSKLRNAEAVGEDDTALSDQGPESNSVLPPPKIPKSKQTRAKKEKEKGKKNKKPLASGPSDSEIAPQPQPLENEQLLQPDCHIKKFPEESVEKEKLSKDAKQPSTDFLTAQQPVNNIDNDQKSVSTTNSATSSFTTATTASTQPSTINSLASFPNNPEREDVKTADIHTRSESKTSAESASNPPDNGGDDNVVPPDHRPDPADAVADIIDVDDTTSKRARSESSELKHPPQRQQQQQVFDIRREKDTIKARIEETRREEHVNQSTDIEEREKLTKMMADLRHVVRRGRVRAREVGWSGDVSLASSAKGAALGSVSLVL